MWVHHRNANSKLEPGDPIIIVDTRLVIHRTIFKNRGSTQTRGHCDRPVSILQRQWRHVAWLTILDCCTTQFRRGKPLFQNHQTYLYYISLEASFQALFRTVFRLKIFPLEVGFFRSRNVHVWGTCLPKIVDSTYFQKN